MHHAVAKDAKELMKTESCVCGTAFCNEVKPKTTVKENERCQAFVEAEVMGTKVIEIIVLTDYSLTYFR
jgi:hypothetical protein